MFGCSQAALMVVHRGWDGLLLTTTTYATRYFLLVSQLLARVIFIAILTMS